MYNEVRKWCAVVGPKLCRFYKDAKSLVPTGKKLKSGMDDGFLYCKFEDQFFLEKADISFVFQS